MVTNDTQSSRRGIIELEIRLESETGIKRRNLKTKSSIKSALPSYFKLARHM